LKTCELKENQWQPLLETKILRELHERLVKSLMDVIVLVELREGAVFLGGYDVIELLHQKFDVLMSSGTVYAILYSMERDGLIMGEKTKNKRVYMLTEKGENKIKAISEVKANILDLLTKIVT
jgi:DNA-binding PadR family transcriptional regulator